MDAASGAAAPAADGGGVDGAAGPARRASPSAWAILAGAMAFLVAAVLVGNELGSFGGDNAEYVMLARSLLRGEGYVSDWAVGPSWPHTQYPPGFPLLLMPFAGDAPARFLGAHLTVALCGGVATGLFAFLYHRRGLPGPVAALAALAPVLGAWWLRCATDLLSELPFLALVAGTLLALEYPGKGPLPRRRIVLAALLAAAAFYTRTAGIALVVPVAAVLCLDGRTRGPFAWAVAAALGAAVSAWFVRGSLLAVSDAATYGGQLAAGAPGTGILTAALHRLFTQFLPGMPSFLLPWNGVMHGGTGLAGWVREGAGWALWILVAAGIALRWRGGRRPGALEGFLVVHIVMVVLWPFSDERFGLPVVPLLALGAVEGLHRILALRPGGSRAQCCVLALAILLCVPNGWRLVTRVYPRAFRATPAVAGVPASVLQHQPARLAETWGLTDEEFAAVGGHAAAYLAICDVVRGDNSLPAGPVLATNPRVAALLTGRKAARPEPQRRPGEPLRAPTAEDVSALLRREGIQLVLVDGFNGPHAAAIRAWADSGLDPFAPTAELGSVRILRLLPR